MHNIEEIKQEYVKVIESSELIEKYVTTLKLVTQKLQKSSDEIVGYISTNKDLSNQEYNSLLWHGLNNIEHQLKQFTAYTETSVQDFAKTSEKFIKTLHSLRPPKD